MENWHGKCFSITDPKGVNTVIYEVHTNEKKHEKKGPRYTMERLKSTEQLIGDMSKKTFYVNNPQNNGNQLAIFSFANEEIIINNGILHGDEIKINKNPMPVRYNKIYSEVPTEVKGLKYDLNLNRTMTIIDPETTEEVKPVLYFDKGTNEVKGKYKLKAYKSYFKVELPQYNQYK